MATPEDEPRIETVIDSVDIRLASLRPEFQELAREVGLNEEQTDDFWTYVRAAYGSGWSDHRIGVKFPGYISNSVSPTPEINMVNDGFRQIISMRLRQPPQD